MFQLAADGESRETDGVFTGLIQHIGTVASIDRTEAAARLAIEAPQWGYLASHGESIAVNGCCLTMTETSPSGQPSGNTLRFDVIAQTLAATNLGTLKVGDRVNLEHAVTPSSLLGGHIVQGHVDGVGTVVQTADMPGEWRVRVEPPQPLLDAIIEKGSIAINGVSLTIATLGTHWFEVALIPTTLRDTTLGELAVGSLVNLETDYIAKTVVHWLSRQHRSTSGA
jgi:riboflavin synthase